MRKYMNKSYPDYKCEKCEKVYDASYVNQRFCSKSCSNAGVHRRTKRINYCSGDGCTNAVEYYTNKFCKQCKEKRAHVARNSSRGVLLENQTIEQASSKRAGGANHYDNIRWASRQKMLIQIKNGCGCVSCGWLHHVHVCHIKAIKDFPKDTKVSVVNDFNNLVLLCPNCHWLFDNDKLVLPEGFEPSTKELCVPL
jgi:hypothetical protein